MDLQKKACFVDAVKKQRLYSLLLSQMPEYALRTEAFTFQYLFIIHTSYLLFSPYAPSFRAKRGTLYLFQVFVVSCLPAGKGRLGVGKQLPLRKSFNTPERSFLLRRNDTALGGKKEIQDFSLLALCIKTKVWRSKCQCHPALR